VIAVVGLTVCGLIAAAFGTQRGQRTAALEAARGQLDLLHAALRKGEADEPIESRLPKILRIAGDALPLAAAVVRDERDQVVASPRSERNVQLRYRTAVASLLIFAVLALAASTTLYRGVNTLRRLEVVEAERDRWQRPADIVRVLDLEKSSAVADIGCGAGYF